MVSETNVAEAAMHVPLTPHMPADEVEKLTSLLKKARCFLEFGAGGSTRLAASLNVPHIYSVESDEAFSAAVAGAVGEMKTKSKLYITHANIGRTKEWGVPVDNSAVVKWPDYPLGIWEKLKQDKKNPNLVLIDGRFRAACALAAIFQLRAGTPILIDDYLGREQAYDVVSKHAPLVEMAGRMAVFEVPSKYDAGALAFDLARNCVLMN